MSRNRQWLAMAAMLFLLNPGEGAAATNIVRIGVPWPPGSKSVVDLKAAARSLSKKTEGRVRVKFVEQHDLDSGAIPCDGALLAGPVLARYSPVSRIFALPLLFRSSAEVTQLQGQLNAEMASELVAQGIEPIAQLDLGFAYLHSKVPVESVAQLEALRLWVPPSAPESLRMAESYGLTPVPLEAAQVREGLRQGSVDAAIAPPLGAILLQWHVEIKSVSDVPWVCLLAVVGMRSEALAALDTSDQALLREELARAFSAVAEELRRKEPEALDVLVKNGVVRQPLGASPEQRDEWGAWSVSVADRLAAEGFIPAASLAHARKTLYEFRAKPESDFENNR